MSHELYLQCYHLLSYFPEISSWNVEKLQACTQHLFQYTSEQTLSVSKILHDIHQTQTLCKLPQVPQRSKEWFDLRLNRLTASDLAQALGKGKFGTRKQLLEKKAFPENVPFKVVPPLKWGTMFEEMGMRSYYEKVHTVHIHEFGLIPHPEIGCFGASPDGITETGIMVEMKCPYNRKCTQEVPEQYYLQIQGQLATCKLSACDYVECYFEVYHDLTEYSTLCSALGTREHGIILEFTKEDGSYVYEYSPPDKTTEECVAWANENVASTIQMYPSYTFLKMTPWRLKHLFHTRVNFDEELWNTIVPTIYQFWKEVEETRERGPIIPVLSTSPNETVKRTLTLLDLEAKKKYRFIEDSDEEN